MNHKNQRAGCYAAAALICFGSIAIAQKKPDSTQAAAKQGGGSDNGTDPSAFGHRVILYDDFVRLGAGVDVNVVYLDLTFSVGKDKNDISRGLLKIEMPFVEAQRNLNTLPLPLAPIAPSAVAGIGDVLFRLFTIPWYSDDKSFKVVAGVDLYVPSAQGQLVFPNSSSALAFVSLGTGKYRAAPAAGFVWKPRPNMLIAPLYWYDMSFAGDPARSNVRLGKFKFFGMYAYPFGLYFLPELQVVSNYSSMPSEVAVLIRKSDVFVRPEIGQVLSKDGTTFYLKPGWGIYDPRPLNRKWGVEGGFRLSF